MIKLKGYVLSFFPKTKSLIYLALESTTEALGRSELRETQLNPEVLRLFGVASVMKYCLEIMQGIILSMLQNIKTVS